MIANRPDTCEMQVSCYLIWVFTTCYGSILYNASLAFKSFNVWYRIVNYNISTQLPEKACDIKHIDGTNSMRYH